LKIGIDARPLHWPGIGRHIRELIKHLSLIDNKNEYYIYFSSQTNINNNRFDNRNFHPVLLSVGVYTISEQMFLPLHIIKDRLDIYHSPSSLVVPMIHPCKLVITVHDLMLKLNPQFISSVSASIYFNIMNWWALRSADKIITISEFTNNEIISLYPGYKRKITVIHNGVSDLFMPVNDAEKIKRIKAGFGIKADYILYLGTYKKHKNLIALVKAYSELPEDIKDGHQLLIIGKRDVRYPEVPDMVRELRLENRVVFRDYIEDSDLPTLYSGADLFVLPSVYEGFGLPVIEAMACGTPVVASRIPVLSEITGGSALLVDPHNIQEMKDSICKILSDKQLSESLSGKGLQQAKRFSWFEAAEKVKEIYESL
jgi:glycosyltransferase involved in cell wall biosynthesis